MRTTNGTGRLAGFAVALACVAIVAAAVGLVAAVASLVAASRSSDGPESPPFVPVADDTQLMTSVIEPAAQVYWEAVGVVMDESGAREIRPETDEEWEAVRNAAFVLAESGNLLMLEERARGREGWTAMSRSLVEAGRRAVAAAEARDTEAVFDMGAELYFVCTGCHAVHALETLRPSDMAGPGAFGQPPVADTIPR